jgi:hypothetical protein
MAETELDNTVAKEGWSPSTIFHSNAVQTRSRVTRQPNLQAQLINDRTIQEPPVRATTSHERGASNFISRRGSRKKKQDNRVQQEFDAWTNEYLVSRQEEDSDLTKVKEWLNQGKPPWEEVRSGSPAMKAYWQQFDSLFLRDGVIRRRLEAIGAGVIREQLVLPRSLRGVLIKLVHCGVAGHLGVFKTQAHVGRRAYWYHWRRDVALYCRGCERCNEFHRGRTAPRQGCLQPMVMGSPFERWSCDLAGSFPKSSRGFTYILTAVCVFSKFIVLVPLRDKSALTVARAIWDHVFLKFGAGDIDRQWM